MIDWDRVSELYNEIGSEDFDEVIEIFLEEVEGIIDKLKEAPNMDELEGDLHFLKGSALNLGFRAFSTLCQKGELLSARGEAHDVELGPIFATYEESKQIFTDELQSRMAA